MHRGHLRLTRMAMASLAVNLALSVGAQWRVGVNAGGGISRIQNDQFYLVSREESMEVDSRPSWLVGATASHALTEPMSFTTGLLFSGISGRDELRRHGTRYENADRTIVYLSMPLFVGIDFHRFRFEVGYQLGVPLYESGNFTSYRSSYGLADTTIHTSEIGLLKTDMGVVTDLCFHLSDRFDLGLRYYHGLQDIKDHSDGYNMPLRIRQLTLNVNRYILPPAKSKPKATGEPVPADQPPD